MPDRRVEQPSLLRRGIRRARRELTAMRHAVRHTTVRHAGHGTVRVSGLFVAHRRLRLDQPAEGFVVRSRTLRLNLPDPAALARLAASGLLRGRIRRLRIRLALAPQWLVSGVRLPRVGQATSQLCWQRRGDTLLVDFRWSSDVSVDLVMRDAVNTVLRSRPWDQVSGPLYILDRKSWVAGVSPWPQGRLAAESAEPELDERGRPLGPYLAISPEPDARRRPAATAADSRPVMTAVANPIGRVLAGAATPYQLIQDSGRLLLRDEAGRVVTRMDPRRGVEASLLSGDLDKYAVVTVDGALSTGSAVSDRDFVADSLRALAATGVVFAVPDPFVRATLAGWGLVTVAEPSKVSDLPGYALSVAAARRMALTGDPALRRTVLGGGGGTLPLPTVSVVLSSMRAENIEECLGYLSAQTYPALEVVVGLHGYQVDEETRARWQALMPVPVRVVPVPAEISLGAVLGRLSRVADGELMTKVDDDDYYGPNHVTDLVIAWHSTGADLAAKGARFVYLPDRGETLDRGWTAAEQFRSTPAGGTILLARGTLQEVGGWSHASRHVDADLLARVKSCGGVVYRTHSLEYVYVRRAAGHTFATGVERLLGQSRQTYRRLPEEIVHPAYPDN